MPVPRLTRILTWVVASVIVGGAFAQPPAQPSGLPPFDHLFLIVLENRGFDQVIGNPDMPAINALARRYALAANDHGVAHPSLPNYVALITGGTWGSHSDDPSQTFDHPTLAGQLEAAGLTWKAYMQGLPSPGFQGAFAGSGGLYAKKHDPFLLVPNIAGDPARARRVVPLTQLGADLETGHAPTFAFIVPDQCHDMHGTGACTGRSALDRAGDAFVDHWVRAIQASSAWTGRSAVVVTFDEAPEGIASLLGAGGNHVATIVIARQGPRGLTSHASTDHYSLLRTLEGAWGLGYLGQAASASSMDALFR
ncbi:MAG: alkaline phosphatase family protein [Deinococcales bacterium]